MSACTVNAGVHFKDTKIESKIDNLLSKMTLEEKAGQMIQLVTDLFVGNDKNGVFHIDEHKTDSIISNYKVGSILNAPNTVAPTVKQWEDYVARIQKISMKRLGIPRLMGLDQNHGSTYISDGILYPQNINLGASFNREITRKAAEAAAYETRAASIPWTFNPTVDLGRDPRWPCIYENFGEDAYVNAQLGAAAVIGFQGINPNHINQQHIAACMKHYMGYGVPWTGKDRTPAFISPAELREKHFAPFLEAINNGVLSVMVNSASVNGLPVHANKELLTTWLKEETGWDGMLITDWADVNNLYTREMIAKDKKEALCIAINAGIDMIMEPYSADAQPLIVELVKEGKISQERIDDAVRRILRMKFRLDLFAHPAQKVKNPSEINSLANYDFKKSQEVGTMEGAYDYDAKITQQWAFGYGMSYTSYKYSNLTIDKPTFTKDDVLTISVDVTNTGSMIGKESVLLYSSDLIASMVPDGRRLRGFEKIELQPDETRTVTFKLKATDLSFVGYDGKWVLEPGDFRIQIGQLTQIISLSSTLTDGEGSL